MNNVLTQTFGVRFPIVLAGMGYVSQPELVAAVSNAGGLGTLRSNTADNMREEIRQVRQLTDRPFGVDILFSTVAESVRAEHTEAVKRQVEVVCEEKPDYLVSGLGNPGPAVPDLHAAGVKIMALVGNVKNAKRVAASGVDFVVAQSYEAGGHTGRVGGIDLIPAIVDAVDVPVIAAGGIADPRQMAAAFVLGACGILMGTRFVATHEGAAHINYKNKIVEIDEEGTILSRAYTGKQCRVIRNSFTQEWGQRENEILPMPLQGKKISEEYFPEIHMIGRRTDGPGDIDMGSCPAGQGSIFITEIKSAAAVVEDMMGGFSNVLKSVQALMADQIRT